MALVDDAKKLEYMQHGVWKDFNDRRVDLKRDGLSPVAAKKQAIAEYDQILRDRTSKGLSANVDTTPLPDVGGAVEEGEELDFSVFDGRPSMSMSAVNQWVFENIYRKGLKMEDCPSAGAYTLYRTYSRSQAKIDEYLKDWASKFVPARAQLEDDTGKEELDDAGMIDHIGKIEAIKAKAEGGRGED